MRPTIKIRIHQFSILEVLLSETLPCATTIAVAFPRGSLQAPFFAAASCHQLVSSVRFCWNPFYSLWVPRLRRLGSARIWYFVTLVAF
ncbi:hypothetical protein A2U01_0030730 [Trifolium medium]|uniref:Uncharacterized protein n=1 Tax=Trifolium medium TaxID=97028 RepID=A0A392PC13_9FABA|nr:hypothetical protein [Trifolium medium]